MTGGGEAPPVGLVLAGGESRRLGSDKARWGSAALPARAAETLAKALAAVGPEVAVADRGRGLLPGRSSLADGPGRGPAAGILGGAAAYPGRPLLVLACDLPRVPAGLLAELVRSSGINRIDWALPRWAGGREPLCALYGPAALALLAGRVEQGRFSLHDLDDLEGEGGLAVRHLEGEDLQRFGDPAEIFLNLNTPEDLERWRRGS